jgi:hypothetical protein
MARIDKYEPVGGGFRGPLLAAITAAQVGGIFGVSVDGAGKVVIGGSANGANLRGVIVPDKPMAAGDVIDVMTDGEIVHASTGAAGAAFAPAVAGAQLFAGATGALSTTTTDKYAGHCMADAGVRLVVRFAR